MRAHYVLQKRDIAPTTGSAQSKAAAPSDGSSEGEVPAEDIQNDSMYLCEVAVGTPAQKLYLDFDTGSSDLWVCYPICLNIFLANTSRSGQPNCLKQLCSKQILPNSKWLSTPASPAHSKSSVVRAGRSHMAILHRQAVMLEWTF